MPDHRHPLRIGAPHRRGITAVALGAVLLGLVACTGDLPEPSRAPSSATPSGAPSGTPAPTPAAPVLRASAADLAGAAEVVADGPAETYALAASTALFAAAPVAVLVGADDPDAHLLAASAAVGLGAPVLLVGGAAPGPAVVAELGRLGTRAVLAVGDVQVPPGAAVDEVPLAAAAGVDALSAATGLVFGAATPVPAGQEVAAVVALGPDAELLVPADRPDAPAAVGTGEEPAGGTAATASPAPGPPSEPTPGPTPAGVPFPVPVLTPVPPSGPSTRPTPAPSTPAAGAGPDDVLPTVRRASPSSGAALLTDGAPTAWAAAATARAAGVPVVQVPGGDPRASAAAVQGLHAAHATGVLALGSVFGTSDVLAGRVAAAASGTELPGGGQLVFPRVPGEPGRRYVALYGTPGTAALGVLGEQDVPATLARAEATAAPYRTLTTDTVVPTLEIIATIASSGPEADGSYSRGRSVEELRPLVEAAGAAGMLVILDLQPGRTDFLTQAQRYTDLLALPYVGLALDPEWRLAPDQVHLRQIGSVGADEINAVSAWLAGLTRERALPQKLLVLHQFSLRMIADRERVDTSHDELAVLIHADGQGSQPAKAGTWTALHQGAPAGVHWGWKNFYDEDLPMLDPTQTFQVQPVPDLVTYQ
ncbi:hypothetical protein AGMMS50218_14850 [Actinomycetota bacterium]|nr:hypothetical protein AGMMS50218_14850 [Actinomycetota bacterium]